MARISWLRHVAMAPCVALAPAFIVLAACSGTDAVAANRHEPSGASESAQQKDKAMSASKQCKDDNLHRAICMVELITEDLDAHYDGVGGGGISQIKAESSTSYTVSLPQEERIDMFTYEFEVKGGTVSIKSKTPSTQSF